MSSEVGHGPHISYGIFQVVQNSEAENHVEGTPRDFRRKVTNINLAKLKIVVAKSLLDEFRLFQVAINDVDAKYIVRACLYRLDGESTAIARTVENSPTTQRAPRGFEELRPAMAHERVYPRALDAAVSHLRQIGADAVWQLHLMMEWS